jgi:hypothetical protein
MNKSFWITITILHIVILSVVGPLLFTLWARLAIVNELERKRHRFLQTQITLAAF